MAVITISAVNTGTDTLTAVAHGLLTGDRFRVRNSTGGSLPAPLAAVTDYFAIRVDVDNVKVATTSANAFLGTAIDITSAGSGTNLIEYGLPYCIPTALAAAGTQIKSTNDNGAWNALVALYDLLTGQAQAVWAAVMLAVGLTLAPNQHVTVSGTGLYKHGTVTLSLPIVPPNVLNTTSGVSAQAMINPCTFQTPIIIPLGKRITACRVRLQDSATGPTKAVLKFCSAVDSGAVVVIATSAASSGSGGYQTISITGLTTVTQSLTSYWLAVSFSTGTATMTVANPEIDYDQP